VDTRLHAACIAKRHDLNAQRFEVPTRYRQQNTVGLGYNIMYFVPLSTRVFITEYHVMVNRAELTGTIEHGDVIFEVSLKAMSL
jgi:hypothetical protein